MDRQFQFGYCPAVATREPGSVPRLTARGAVTKARIVAEATSLVRERGVAGTSLDAVMNASGTSRSQLYHYFADKDALISEVIKTQLGRVIAAQEPRLSEVTSWSGLLRWCEHLVAMTRTTQGIGGCPRLPRRRARRPVRLGAPRDRALVRRMAVVSVHRLRGHARRRRTRPRRRSGRTRVDDDECAAGRTAHGANHAHRPTLELALDMALGHVAGYRNGPTRDSAKVHSHSST